MILLLLLQLTIQQFPLGLTGEKHTDPLYWTPGPRTIILLRQVDYKDSIKKDTIKITKKPNGKKNEGKH